MSEDKTVERKDKAVTYAFLSVIKEKSGNVTSLTSIFEELVEGILSTWTRNGINSARIVDLQHEFKTTYIINIPIPTLRVLVKKISEKYTGAFTIHTDDSFIISNFPNKDFSYLIDKQKGEIDLLYDLYFSYIKTKGLEPEKYDLLEYIEENKKQILQFMSGDFSLKQNDYQIQAHFIKELLGFPEYSSMIQRLFLGSIISSYIELDIDESMDKNKILLLDTNFIISLLDLHSIESFINCKMLIELAKKLKYKIEIMPFTIEETTALLNRIASNLNDLTYFQSQEADSIYHGCFRKNISSTTLSLIAQKFVSKLQSEYGIIQTDMSVNNSMINLARQSKYYSQLKNRINNPDGALHDATLLYYVQHLRKQNPLSFADINAWFVTDTKGFSDNIIISPKGVPLMIRAEELLNIMWISHPLYNSEDFVQKTIAKTLSSTLNNSLPNIHMLREIDKKVQAIKDYPINTRDCIQIAEVLGSIENQHLKTVIESRNQQEIIRKLHDLSVLAKKKALNEKNEKEIIAKLAMEKLQNSFEYEKRTLEKIKKEEMENASLESRNSILNTRISMLEEIIKRDTEELNSIKNNIILPIELKSKMIVKNILIISGVICILLFFYIAKLIFENWSNAEPILYLLGFIPLLISYFLTILTTKKFSVKTITEAFVTRLNNKQKKKNLYFLNKAFELEKRIVENEKDIEEIKRTLIYN
jgi:hypothetical protein